MIVYTDRERFGFAKALRSRPLLSFLVIALLCTPAIAQRATATSRQKLPSPEKIVNDYLKAVGGKKRVATIRDATYEWQAQTASEQSEAVSQLKSPASMRLEVSNAGVAKMRTAANGRSAWISEADGSFHTLTDAEANAAKLQAALSASRLIDYKKQRTLARTVTLDETGTEPAYVVEFSSRNGARLRYSFGASSKLLSKIADDAQKTVTSFSDYRPENGLLEPHRIEIESGQTGTMTLVLKSARYNTGLGDELFDPPRAETIDVAALLKEVDSNQEKLEEHVDDYTYTEKRTERKINGRGEVTEETVKVFEIYPIPNQEAVRKLISENGVALSAEKAAKEEKRVTEELEKAERERGKVAEKRERAKEKARKEGKSEEDDDDIGVADFLRVAELVSPRREQLRGREAIVFDFRPRAGYKPKSSAESLISKLAGVIWVDPADKQVMRLEARLVDSYKMAGGLIVSVRPGTALAFEQKRMEDGVWLPVFSQVNISAKIFIFKGIDLNFVQEFSNYQRFNSSFEEYKLAKPDEKENPAPKP